jgi:hypothetical protein
MNSPRRDPWRGLVLGSLATLAVAGGPAHGAATETTAAPCRVATIAGIAVTDADADAMRGLIQPPPTREQARRLAVDAALAWWDVHGFLAGSSARGRLDAWRGFMAAGEPGASPLDDARDAAAELRRVETAAGLVPGACFASAPRPQATSEPTVAPSPRTASTARWLEQSVDAERVHVRLLRQEEGLVPALRSGSFPLRHLETPLALALRRLAPGEVAGPIATDSGTYWVERLSPTASPASSTTQDASSNARRESAAEYSSVGTKSMSP